jgi:Fur family ferric uptake transcriptional regulator
VNGKIETKCESLLKGASLRRTGPRMAVLSALLKAKRPITQEEIAAKTGANGPDKVTIYRILEILIDAGLVHKVYLSERAQHFELADNCTESQCHPHFTCSSCGQTFCMTDLSLPLAKSPHRGFKIEHQQVRLEGLCPECK